MPELSYYKVTADNCFEDDFETGQLNDNWAWRFADQTSILAELPTRPSNIVGVFNNNGFDSEFGVIMGKSCDDGFATNALDLHLDLEGLTVVELDFVLWDIADETHADDGIYISDDGGALFVKVFDFEPGGWCDQFGRFPPLRIHELIEGTGLELTSTFIIRFQQHDDGDFGFGSVGPDGLIMDNIQVCVPDYTYYTVTAAEPFEEDFETGSLRNMWRWDFADETATLATPFTKPSNFADVCVNCGLNSQFGVGIGKACDDGFATNALDLYLNLSQVGNIELNYWLFNNSDETHIDDGIYFSNDGGESFHKIFDYDFSNIQTNDWVNLSHNISDLVAAIELGFSNQCILRFQQHDDGDFNFGSIAPDGIFLDNFNIQGEMISAVANEIQPTISVYPNPATDFLTVQWVKQQYDEVSYRIMDMNGRLLQSGALNHSSQGIKIQNLPDGLLLLEIMSAEQKSSLRFVKTRG